MFQNENDRRDIMTMMNNDKLGCLIIHGFGGGIFEIESLADYLIDMDYIVACHKLKGHTGIGKDMKTADYKDWISSAEEELIKLMEKTQSIAIIGFSMGGLIAVNLACKYDIKTIVTINTPIYYWNLYRVGLNIFDDCKNRRLNNIKRYIMAKNASPMTSMINFLRLLNSTKAKLSDISCPFLILQTKDDDTTRLKSTNYIYDNIKSAEKRIILYEKGGHQVLISPYKEKIIMDIEEFLNSLISTI
jgi:carboxylesterase